MAFVTLDETGNRHFSFARSPVRISACGRMKSMKL